MILMEDDDHNDDNKKKNEYDGTASRDEMTDDDE